MKQIGIILILNILLTTKVMGQIDGRLLLNLINATTTEMLAITNPSIGALVYNTTERAVYDYNGSSWNKLDASNSSTNWDLFGNSGINPNTTFLSTTDDVKMEIRSNNLPLLRLGRRQTLGLTQNFPDYRDNDQPLVYVNGDGSVSALQFSASGAAFYKPMFFTTANGSFRLKGSAGRTDLFEIGSAGPSNDGKLEFTIGDDGAEPIIFKRYDYRLGQFHTEFFRVQGSNNSQNAKTRFGININPQRVAVDADYNDSSAGFNIANSTLQVKGSIATSIISTTSNLTLTEDHYTVIIGGNHNISLPNANTCTGRIYIIKNPRGNNISISTYRNERNSNDSTVDRQSILWIQSDGTNWQQIK